MFMYNRKRLLSLLLVFALLFMIAAPASARTVPDPERNGSVSVVMKDGGAAVSGGTLSLYRVGDILEDDGNYSFVLTEEFRAADVPLDDPAAQGLAQQLADYAKAGKMQGVTRAIGTDGTVLFADLKPGLFLFVQETPADGYEAVSPFLVSVPMKDGEDWLYDVDASPKVALKKAPEKPGEPELPNTGQLNWPVPVLLTAGLALFAAGWAIYFSQRKKNREK